MQDDTGYGMQDTSGRIPDAGLKAVHEHEHVHVHEHVYGHVNNSQRGTLSAKADCDRDQSLLLATDDRQPIPQKPIPIPTGNRELKNKEPRGLPGLH